MNSTIVAAIIVVGIGGSLALLVWWLNHRSNGRKSTSKTTSEWTSEGDTSFVSKISETTADSQRSPVEKPKSQAPDN
jgi:hypothetical protein